MRPRPVRYLIDGGQVELGLLPITSTIATLFPPGITLPITLGVPTIDTSPPTFSEADFPHVYRLAHGTLRTPGDRRFLLTGNALNVPDDMVVLGYRLRGTGEIAGVGGTRIDFRPVFSDTLDFIAAPTTRAFLPGGGRLKVEWVGDFVRSASQTILFGVQFMDGSPIYPFETAQIEVLGVLVEGRFG